MEQPIRAALTGGGLRGALGAEAVAGFAQAERAVPFVFPRDHGPHPEFRSEWWYLTAVLATAGGRRFGVQFTLFRQALRPNAASAPAGNGWRTGQAYMGHLAVSDVAARRHWHAERLVRGHPALAGVRASPFVAHIDGWRLASMRGGVSQASRGPSRAARPRATPAEVSLARGSPSRAARLRAAPAEGSSMRGARPSRSPAEGSWRLEASVAGDGATPPFAVDLVLDATRRIVRQGDRGFSRKGPRSASYYYSVPRIDAAGSVAVADQRHQVTGTAWLDREWTSGVLERHHAGWDWFALHLDDGRDLMVCQLRRRDGERSPYDFGALTDAGGSTRILGAADFALEATHHWRGWPVAWRLTLTDRARNVPSETLLLRAAFPDQVMALSVLYWEGVVDATAADGTASGSGYMELTGYG